MSQRLSIAFIALAVALATHTDAATSKKAHRPQAKTTQSSTTVGPTFDASRKSLPPHFTGNDFRSLYQRLSIAPKGEFETTDEYQARLSAVPRATYAFRVPKVKISYAADEQLLNVEFYTDFFHSGWELAYSESMLVVAVSETETGHYVGSNAFGATRLVKKVTSREWGIRLRSKEFSSIDLKIPMPTARARVAKSRVAVVAVCEVGPESVPARMTGEQFEDMHAATGFNISSATIDAPTDLKSYFYVIEARVLGLWAYDTETGEVFGKFDLDGVPLPKGGLPAAITADVSEILSRVTVGMSREAAANMLTNYSRSVTHNSDGSEEWNFGVLGFKIVFKDNVVSSTERVDSQ